MPDKLSFLKPGANLVKQAFIRCFHIKELLCLDQQIPILFYHQICDGGLIKKNQRSCVSANSFKEQMGFLRIQGYSAVTLDDIYSWIDGKKRLSRKTVCITFDDGHGDNFYNAFPVLKEHGFKATIFISPEQMERKMWYSRKSRKWERVFDDKDDLYFEFLSWPQIREMDKYGIDFQAHTCTHPYLTDLSKGEIIKELKNSKVFLEQKLNKSVDFLSYPYGDYNNDVINTAMECGYRGAVTCDWGLVGKNADKFRLKRQYVLDKDIMCFQMNLHHLDPMYDRLSGIVKSVLK